MKKKKKERKVKVPFLNKVFGNKGPEEHKLVGKNLLEGYLNVNSDVKLKSERNEETDKVLIDPTRETDPNLKGSHYSSREEAKTSEQKKNSEHKSFREARIDRDPARDIDKNWEKLRATNGVGRQQTTPGTKRSTTKGKSKMTEKRKNRTP